MSGLILLRAAGISFSRGTSRRSRFALRSLCSAPTSASREDLIPRGLTGYLKDLESSSPADYGPISGLVRDLDAQLGEIRDLESLLKEAGQEDSDLADLAKQDLERLRGSVQEHVQEIIPMITPR